MSDQNESHTQLAADTRSGVVVGVLLGLSSDNVPLVAFPGGPDGAIRARSTLALRQAHIGSQVALMFENGQWDRPLVIGKILIPGVKAAPANKSLTVRQDQDVLTLNADREIVLQCGEASITLTRAGKIILRGTYVLSRSSGANKIKGGSVQIN